VIFVVPSIWVSRQPGFQLVDVWHLSVVTVIVQAVASLWLLRGQFRARLSPAADASCVAEAGRANA
jgi:hypothetical protein